MAQGRIVIDGLWRCLCPSVDAAAIYQTLRRPIIPRRRRPVVTTNRSASTEAIETQAQTNAEPHIRENGPPSHKSHKERRLSRGWRESSSRAPLLSSTIAKTNHERYAYRKWKRHRELPRSFFTGQGSSDEELDAASTEAIVEGLRELCVAEGQYHGICNTVRYLVTRRNKKADVFLYDCLIRANADPEYGSAKAVGDLIAEMESTHVQPTPATYHSVLEVLAVHPDYVLRNRTIQKMEAIWKPPTFDGEISITVGLIRDGQYEMALESLEKLYTAGVPIPTWLYDIFIYTFGSLGAHEETLMILQHRARLIDAPTTHNLWQYLLDIFSRDAFYEGTKTVWNRMVMLGKVVASDGTAINVLNTAAKNDDANIATQVIEQLLRRGTRLGMHHFEPLLEVQARNHEIPKAMSTICLMTKAGLLPDRSSTRPVLAPLLGAPRSIDTAVGALRDLKKIQQVPIAAFNVVLEAVLLVHGFPSGLDLYRSLAQICSDRPSSETYDILLQHCNVPKFMRFLVAEMEAFSIAPKEVALDRMIYISTLNPNYELAFRYLEQMVATKVEGRPSGWWISQPTAIALLKRATQAKDSRAQGLMEACKNRETIRQADIEVLLNATNRGHQMQGFESGEHETVEARAEAS